MVIAVKSLLLEECYFFGIVWSQRNYAVTWRGSVTLDYNILRQAKVI